MNKKVLIFTMEGCPWCTKLKEQLDEREGERKHKTKSRKHV